MRLPRRSLNPSFVAHVRQCNRRFASLAHTCGYSSPSRLSGVLRDGIVIEFDANLERLRALAAATGFRGPLFVDADQPTVGA